MISYVFGISTRIYATIHPDNTVSIKVSEKIGFDFLRSEIDEDGTPVNFYIIEHDRTLFT